MPLRLHHAALALACLASPACATPQLTAPHRTPNAVEFSNAARHAAHVGDLDEAARLHHRALTLEQATLGPEHPAIADRHLEIAAVYDRLHRPERSLRHTETAAGIRLASYGSEHPMTAEATRRVARLLAARGDHRRAIDRYRQSLRALERFLGHSNPELADLYVEFAESLASTGDVGGAFAYHSKALRIYDAVFGVWHDRASQIRTAMRELLPAMQR